MTSEKSPIKQPEPDATPPTEKPSAGFQDERNQEKKDDSIRDFFRGLEERGF